MSNWNHTSRNYRLADIPCRWL